MANPTAYGATPYIYRKVMSQMSFADTDPTYLSQRNLGFRPIEVTGETATYFKHDVNAAYETKENAATKFSTPESHNTSDEPVTYNIQAIADAFEASNADLSQAEAVFHMSRQDYINAQRFFTTMRQKKAKDVLFNTFVQTDGNYDAAAQIFSAGIAWNNYGTADPLSDIEAARRVIKTLTGMYLNDTILSWLQQNQTIKNSVSITGPKFGSGVDPSINVEFLMNYFKMNEIYFINGEVEDDSQDPTEDTKSDIWGNSVLLYTPEIQTPGAPPNLMNGAWMKHLFWRPEDLGEPGEGWAWIEKQKEGGVAGVTKWELWNHFKYHSHDPRLAVRIDDIVV